MATRRDTRTFSSTTTSHFATVNDYGQVVNTSGQPSPNTQTVRKREVVAQSVPQGRPGHRGATQINGRDGEHFRDQLDQATTAAVRQAPIARAVEETEAGPRTLDMIGMFSASDPMIRRSTP